MRSARARTPFSLPCVAETPSLRGVSLPSVCRLETSAIRLNFRYRTFLYEGIASVDPTCVYVHPTPAFGQAVMTALLVDRLSGRMDCGHYRRAGIAALRLAAQATRPFHHHGLRAI